VIAQLVDRLGPRRPRPDDRQGVAVCRHHGAIVALGACANSLQDDVVAGCRRGVVRHLARRSARRREQARVEPFGGGAVERAARQPRGQAFIAQEIGEQQRAIPGIAGAGQVRARRAAQHALIGVEPDVVADEMKRRFVTGSECCGPSASIEPQWR
jgi:hypothetical protein